MICALAFMLVPISVNADDNISTMSSYDTIDATQEWTDHYYVMPSDADEYLSSVDAESNVGLSKGTHAFKIKVQSYDSGNGYFSLKWK